MVPFQEAWKHLKCKERLVLLKSLSHWGLVFTRDENSLFIEWMNEWMNGHVFIRLEGNSSQRNLFQIVFIVFLNKDISYSFGKFGFVWLRKIGAQWDGPVGKCYCCQAWVLGTKLMSSGLIASAFTHEAICQFIFSLFVWYRVSLYS